MKKHVALAVVAASLFGGAASVQQQVLNLYTARH